MPLAGLKEQSNTGQMFFLDMRSAFDGAGGVDVADDGVGLVAGVAELEERGGHGVVHDLDHAAADQLLVLHEREIGLDAGGVAVHHEADGAGGSEHGDLRVAIAVTSRRGERASSQVALAASKSGPGTFFWLMLLTEARCMRMTSRNGSRLTYQPGQAPPVISTACVVGGGGCKRLTLFGDLRRLEISFAAHDGGDAGGVVASGVGVVGKSGSHEQRAEIGVAETERTIVVRVLHDRFRRVAGVVDENFLRGDGDGAGVTVGGDVEGAVGGELHQIQRREVAGGVVEEHVLAAGIAGVDARGVLAGVPAVHGGVVLHAGIAALPGGFADLLQKVAGLVGLDRTSPDLTALVEKSPSRTTAYMKSSVTRTELFAFWKKMVL